MDLIHTAEACDCRAGRLDPSCLCRHITHHDGSPLVILPDQACPFHGTAAQGHRGRGCGSSLPFVMRRASTPARARMNTIAVMVRLMPQTTITRDALSLMR